MTTDSASGSSAGTAARPPYDAVVLAGGGARRLGGTDKPALTVGGRSLLDRVLSACPDASTTVVVGPRRPVHRPVTWAREDPPGGGPLAALDAGLAHTSEDTVLVLSADLPFLTPATVRALLDTAEHEGAVLHDGRDQPLLATYRTEPLRRELALLRTEYGRLAGLPMRLLLPALLLRRVTPPAARAGTGKPDGPQQSDSETPGTPVPSDALDCDTWDDIAAARARIREHDTVLDEWTSAVKAELGIDLDVDTAAILDLARDAAHGVARPAAPLTTFLVGYAAALRGGSPEDVAGAAHRAAGLAARWAAEAEQGSGSDAPAATDTTGTEDGR